jgi:chromosome segregation protein
MARADREAETLVERENALRSEGDGITTEIASATTREREAREALLALHAADAVDRVRLAESERAAATARERLRAADERARAADHTELEARLGLDSLRESVLIELAGLGDLGLASLGIARPEAMAEADTAIQSDADDSTALASADEPPTPGRLAQLRRRYHELGAANPYAVEEYAELKARLESLETHGDDLRAAIGRTRELIVELDTMIATQFRTTFAALETAFERRFEQLFDGGFAKLSLTDPSDLGSTGVEIVARPPGKKPQALAMLSGGERALTAVALLFAMLEVRPVPFCVLDEVDAALDEANIGRFAEALRSLADRTQFIVITHNRGTIEAADALYGVTVGDDSVSRVISLRLDEAQALASERRELSAAG